MRKNTRFRRYLKHTFKQSLIASFSTISTAKTWVEKMWKAFVFLACLAGCIYQTLDFIQFYLTYPTTINVEESNPFEIPWPAITICNNNRISRRSYCEKFTNSCIHIRLSDLRFCRMYPRYCDYTTEFMFKKVPKNTSHSPLEDVDHSWEIAWDMLTKKSVVESCKLGLNLEKFYCYYTWEHGVSMNYTEQLFPFMTLENKPSFCYTLFSQIGDAESEETTFPNSIFYELELNAREQDFFDYNLTSLVYIVIHDRKRLINPYSKGIVLKGGRRYIAYISMTEVIRLPPPYKSNCTDYLKLWRENGGYGPMIQSDCTEHCKLMKIKSLGKCIDEHVNYPNYEKICAKGYETTTDEIIEDCSKQCQLACRENSYKMVYEELGSEEDKISGGSRSSSKNKILIRFSFRKFRLTRRIYQPKFNDIELFSYVGGYMGMWLGISLVSILDLLESLSMLFCYIVRTKSKKNLIK